MSRLFLALLVSASVLTPFTAQAFGLPGVPGLGSKSSDSGSADLAGAQDQLVKQYVAGNKNVMLGNAYMLEAVGLKVDAATLRQGGENLGEGATKSNLSDSDKATSDASQKFSAKLKDTTALDADSKKKFAEGLVSMAAGMAKYVGMKNSFDSFTSGLKTASPMMLPKLQSGAYIVSSLPSNVTNLGSTLKNAIEFAKSHDIEVPSDVTAALNSKF
jgi:hypothetical protein